MTPADAPMRVAAIVLAAGASRRMGQNKMLVPVRGEPLICSAVRAVIDGACDPVVIVVGPDERAMRDALAAFDVRFVTNPGAEAPPGASFQTGLAAASDADAAIMVLGDMVDLTGEMVRRLCASAADPDTAIVLSEYGDGVTTPPYLIRRELFSEVLHSDAVQVVRRLATRHVARVRTLRWPSENLTDVDTPADLEALRRRVD